jgi:hypothetical protein
MRLLWHDYFSCFRLQAFIALIPRSREARGRDQNGEIFDWAA